MVVSWDERKFGYAAREEWSVVECQRDMLGSDLRQTTQDAMLCAVCLHAHACEWSKKIQIYRMWQY